MDLPEWKSDSESTLQTGCSSSSQLKHCEKCDHAISRDETATPASSVDIEVASTASTPASRSGSYWICWDGTDDPEHPQNFRLETKCLIAFLSGMMNFVVSFAISLFSGVVKEAADEFGCGKDTMQLALTLYILGLAFGPLLFGPASEYCGRKIPLALGMVGFMVFTLFVTFSKDLYGVLLCRFLAGACGSAAYVIPPGLFVDLFDPVGRAIGYMAFATAAFIGGSLGPPIGALIVANGFDWRWTMWMCTIIALPPTASLIVVPETLEAVILQKRASWLRIKTGDWTTRSRRDEVPLQLRDYLLKPWSMLISESVLMVITVAFTLDYGIQSLTYSARPCAFGYRYWSIGSSAWALSITIVGFAFGFAIVAFDTKIRLGKQLSRGEQAAPESRLPPMVIVGPSISRVLADFDRLPAWRCSP